MGKQISLRLLSLLFVGVASIAFGQLFPFILDFIFSPDWALRKQFGFTSLIGSLLVATKWGLLLGVFTSVLSLNSSVKDRVEELRGVGAISFAFYPAIYLANEWEPASNWSLALGFIGALLVIWVATYLVSEAVAYYLTKDKLEQNKISSNAVEDDIREKRQEKKGER